VATLLAVSMLSACDNPGSTASKNARAEIKVLLPQGLDSTDVARLGVVVEGPGIATPIAVELGRNGSAWEGVVNDIPAGADRLFTATAYDSGSIALYKGQAGPLSILSASTASVAIVLQPVNPLPPFENVAPRIESLAVSSNPVQPGGTVTLTARASDSNPSDTLSYTWSAPAGTFGSPTSATTSFTAPANEGVLRLQLEVKDSRAASATMGLDLHVQNPGSVGNAVVSASFNTWPSISFMTGTPSPLVPGVPTKLFASATDADGDALSFSWSSGNCPGSFDTLSSPQVVFTLSPQSSTSSCSFQVLVSDGRGGQQKGTLILHIGDKAAPAAPVARPGTSRTVLSRKPVTLDGSESSASNGALLTFAWSFVSRPSGSTAALSDPTAMKPTFIPDLDGDYVVQLVVSDGDHLSAPATLALTAQNRAPVANAGADLVVSVGFTVSPRGQGSDDNGDTLSFTWTLTRKPTGSTITLSGANTPAPSLKPDLEGLYELSLVVDDGLVASPADTVVISAERPITRGLSHRVLDAEYSKALDRVVMVSTNPDTLYLYNPLTHTETSVVLPLTPTSVSVGPDGKFAVVGHDAYISYVDLSTPALLKTIPVSADVFDIVLAGNGYAYVFPRVDQWVSIHSIHLATGTETLGSSYGVRAGTRARLHPGGIAMYGANNGLSPDDIERYDISAGSARVAYDSPYHGSYYMCGDLWFSEDGARIFTRCGNTFRASNVRSEDMVYSGALPGVSGIRHLTHSTAANRIALVQESYSSSDVGRQVRLYTPDFLNFDQAIALPPFKANATEYASYGRFVFYSAAGDKLIVVVQADPSSAMLNDYGIVTF
jgi:hypothetical protein